MTLFLSLALTVLGLPAQSPAQLSSASSPPASHGAAPSAAWFTRAAHGVARAEYEFRRSEDEPVVASAPNRAHGLRARVSRAGLAVFPRVAGMDGAGAAWNCTLQAARFGRVGDLRALEPATVAIDARVAALDHRALTERFENGERGIEHAFAVSARPHGLAPLWIGIDVRGDLALRIDDGARSGVLVDAHGEARLRYRDLLARDATGLELCATLASSAHGAGIQIDDARATYPVSVALVLTGPAWTAAGDQLGAEFGGAVATAGDVNGDGYSDVIVGARLFDGGETDEGRVLVYYGSALGLSATPDWTAESDQAGAELGAAVALAGDVNDDGFSDVIVGARLFDGGETDEGRVLVYYGSVTGLSATPDWTAESDQAGAEFGGAVATAGDVNNDGFSDVVVGARLFDNGETDEGRAFVYFGAAVGLSATPDWTAESDQASAEFGSSVANCGDVDGDGFSDVAVGAPLFDDGELDEGRAFAFFGSATGPSSAPDWTAASDQVGARFGACVATAGDVDGDGFCDVIIGAPLFDGGELDEGRVSVFLGSFLGLPASPDWTSESDQTDARFGAAASSAGDVNADAYGDVVVGAPLFDDGELDEGRVLVFIGSPSGLAATPEWIAQVDRADARLGASVALAGDVNADGYSDVLVGAPLDDDGELDEGLAFVHHGSSDGLKASAAWTASGEQAFAILGRSVAFAGDVNGDGFSDVLVGATGFDDEQLDEGRAYAFHGSANGLSTTPAWFAESDDVAAFFASSVASAGDVNGDGFGDVVVGAPYYGPSDVGRVFVYHGSPAGLALAPATVIQGDQSGAEFGICVASAGDVNGDGFGDVIVGADLYDDGQTDEGRAFVYQGSLTGLQASASWTAASDMSSARFGNAVASAGDVDADGYSDVLVGAWRFTNGQSSEGRAFAYRGSASGLSATADWTAECDQSFADFAFSLASAGDVNGDGFSDVIVGAARFDDGQTNEGRAFVYHGSASGLVLAPSWTAEGDQTDGNFAHSVASAGDVNGDGYSDVIIGAWVFDGGSLDEGRASVYQGAASGLASTPAWTAAGGQDVARFGISVSLAGDVNGDGYGDVIVGSDLFDDGEDEEGRAFVYMGNAGRGGWTRAPQQRRARNGAPIGPLCVFDSRNHFRVQLASAHYVSVFTWATPRAPGAALQWQVAPLGTPYASVPLSTGDGRGLGVPFPVFSELTESGTSTSLPSALVLPVDLTRGPFAWRLRLRNNNPVFPVSPWMTLPGSNATETKLRATSIEMSGPLAPR
ncbi:MAG: integrin alpha [Planctomycetota bacterium]